MMILIEKNILPEIEEYLSFIHRNWNIEFNVHNLLMKTDISEAAVILADTVKQLPQNQMRKG
jgi:uncharacterized membrane-anchored protein YjiN (DUF445 family)